MLTADTTLRSIDPEWEWCEDCIDYCDCCPDCAYTYEWMTDQRYLIVTIQT